MKEVPHRASLRRIGRPCLIQSAHIRRRHDRAPGRCRVPERGKEKSS
jgi:hypothetical protein